MRVPSTIFPALLVLSLSCTGSETLSYTASTDEATNSKTTTIGTGTATAVTTRPAETALAGPETGTETGTTETETRTETVTITPTATITNTPTAAVTSTPTNTATTAKTSTTTATTTSSTPTATATTTNTSTATTTKTSTATATTSSTSSATSSGLVLDGIWSGDVDLVAPGFYGPPVDRFVLSFANGKLSSSGFDKLSLPRTYGDAATDFPLAGHRLVMPGGSTGYTHDVTVQEAVWAPRNFRFCFHATDHMPPSDTDFVECISGNLDEVGLHVQHSIKGSLYGSDIDAHASGVLTTAKMAKASQMTLDGIWSGDVDLVAPGFYGPPIDRLVLSFANGKLRSSGFDELDLQRIYGDAATDFPLAGHRLVMPGGSSAWTHDVTVQEATWTPTNFEFCFRAGARVAPSDTDFVECISGNLDEVGLHVQHSIKGLLYNAEIDAHASGILTSAGMPKATRTTLAGKWSGDVKQIRSDGPPNIARLVVELSADHKLAYFEFDQSVFGHCFGTKPGYFPLSGTATVTGGSSGFSYIAEVNEAFFSATTFSFRHHVVNLDDETGPTDYVEQISGTIEDGRLVIHWDFDGVLWIAPFDNSADGILTAQP